MVKKKAELAPNEYDDGALALTGYFQAQWKKRAIEIVGTLEPHEQHKAGRMALDQLKQNLKLN